MSYLFDERLSESPLVNLIWRTQSTHAIPFISQAVATWEMVITRQHGKVTLSILGPETKPFPADGLDDAEFFGIQFKVGSFMPHLSASSLVDSAIHLPAASGSKVWVNGAAWEIPTFENADTFLNRLTRQGIVTHDPVITAALNNQPTHLSPRTLQRRFLSITGLTHGMIVQIERARRALTLLEQGGSILDAVDLAGYADQAHMTRAFRRYFGQTPAQLAHQPISALSR